MASEADRKEMARLVGNRRFFHVTDVESLHQALEFGRLEPNSFRRFGRRGRKGSPAVFLSLLPAWYLLNGDYTGREAAIVALQADPLVAAFDCRPCPVNSHTKLDRADPYLRGAISPVDALRECLRPEHRKTAEVLFREPVPTRFIEEVVLPDERTVSRWSRLLRRASKQDGVDDLVIRVSVPGVDPYFPPDFTVDDRDALPREKCAKVTDAPSHNPRADVDLSDDVGDGIEFDSAVDMPAPDQDDALYDEGRGPRNPRSADDADTDDPDDPFIQ